MNEVKENITIEKLSEISNFSKEITGVASKKQQFRSNVMSFETMLKEHPTAMDRNDSFMQDLLQHTFCKGLYARDLAIPAGMALTGEIHFDEHLVFLMEGEILVSTEEGNKHLKAPQYFVTLGGTKRAAIALTDTLWVTVHQI